MWNAGLDEAQVRIKIASRNINNLRCANHITLMAEIKEELETWWKRKSEKVGLRCNIQKTKIMASSPITSWQIDGETMETVTDCIFLGFKFTPNGDCSHEIKKLACRKPAWGTLPMAKVMRKEARQTQRRDGASRLPLEILEHLPPKPESAYFLLCALTYTSDFRGGCPPPPSLSWISSSSHMWLFRASQLWEAWDVLNCLNTDSFEQLKDWLEIVLVKGFSLFGPMFATKFPYPLPAVSLAVYWLI